ncbi:HEAT repeat domain-containing protein [Geomonas ferrireducens]|uniref:HEAT repeat domain-containing protein n=1 Tax=Geomonas ferrireducens TaxID=2570227 RepID=UPI0010A91D33|nr:HEAT repeat domain-containing protein [Geomonas ferrireducens]
MSDRTRNAGTQETASSPLLVKLIRDLNVARRNMRTYPQGHQVIDVSLATALKSYASLLGELDEVVLLVAGSTLMLGDQPVDRSNPVMRDFARVLHEREIGALVFHRGLTREELRRFIIILGSTREKIYRAGGIRAVWEKSGITSFGIREIRYDLLSVTEEPLLKSGEAGSAGDLWERFALALKNGMAGGGALAEGALDPELVAEALNLSGQDGLLTPGGFAPLLLDALVQGETASPQARELTNQRFAGFVSKLNPAMRQQFLGAAWASKAIAAPDLASIVSQVPAQVVMETLEEIGPNQEGIPQVVLQLLRQFSGALSSDELQAEGADLQTRVRTILREHASEEFIPKSYQQKLHRMMEPDQVPLLGSEGVQDLLETIDQSSIEKKTGDMLLLFLKSVEGEVEELTGYERSLYDIGIYFLRTGAYTEFLNILREVNGGGVPLPVKEQVLELFACEEFINEVLDGLQTWGKPRFNEIAEVILTVGAPFTDGLLDRLAESESMSLRRFIMDRLAEIGTPAAPAIIKRLSDRRWYFLRNLIQLIRRLELYETVDKLRMLAHHSDRRVSSEAFRALLEFGEAGAEEALVRDLESPDRQTRLAALEVAGMARSPRGLGALHAMLATSGFSKNELQVKGLAVQALGEIGDPASLPVLEKLLYCVSLLHLTGLTRLKLDTVSTLWRYPSEASLPLLRKVASKRGAVGRQAALLLRGRQEDAS